MRTPAALRRKALAQLAREQRLTKRLAAIDGTVIDPGKRSKWNARKTVYRGITYDSLAEAERASWLDAQMRVGQVRDWERQCEVIVLDGPKARDRVKLIVDYWVDYVYRGPRYEDVKGVILPAFNLKVQMWRRHVPHQLWVITRNKDGSWTEKQVADGVLPAWLDLYR